MARCRGRGGSSDAGNLNGGLDHADVDRLKQEILTEIRKEVHKMKQEIIDGKRNELAQINCSDPTRASPANSRLDVLICGLFLSLHHLTRMIAYLAIRVELNRR